jgi:hypothetical protein
MILRLTTVHENARSALECGGSTPPYINLEREGQGGVEPPHSKVPSAQSFLWQRGTSLCAGLDRDSNRYTTRWENEQGEIPRLARNGM